MRYERKKEENSEVFYEVLENSTKAAEFSYQQKFDETGQVWMRYYSLSSINAGAVAVGPCMSDSAPEI